MPAGGIDHNAINPRQRGKTSTKTKRISNLTAIRESDIHAEPVQLDALLKRALVLNYDPTCVDEANATQLQISPTGELHLFWGHREYEYLYAVAETTPIRDESIFTEMRLLYSERRSDRSRTIIANFLRYLIAEDQAYCRIPPHMSYYGQIDLMRRMEASAQYFERAF